MNRLFSGRLVAALYLAFALMTASGVYFVRSALDSPTGRATPSAAGSQLPPERRNVNMNRAVPAMIVFVMGAAGLLLLCIRPPMQPVHAADPVPSLSTAATRAQRVPILLGWVAQANGSAVRVATSDGDESSLVSYLTLRRIVGTLGIGLPVALAMWGFALGYVVEPSISDYYALRTRDLFVGTLFTLGWFLFTYRGFDWRDEVAGTLACVFALGVALFPNNPAGLESNIHFASAAALFLTLAYFSLALFTRTNAAAPTPQKRIRNRVYRTCGVLMLLCIALIAIYHIPGLDHSAVAAMNPVFWLETLALWAFGFSWFVKGETLWQDDVA